MIHIRPIYVAVIEKRGQCSCIVNHLNDFYISLYWSNLYRHAFLHPVNPYRHASLRPNLQQKVLTNCLPWHDSIFLASHFMSEYQLWLKPWVSCISQSLHQLNGFDFRKNFPNISNTFRKVWYAALDLKFDQSEASLNC